MKAWRETQPRNVHNRFSMLALEPLETRLLLAALVAGTDTEDGDEYQIKLSGPGTISKTDLDDLVLSGTTHSSTLAITVTMKVGDGLVNIGSISTGSADLNKLIVQGDLGALSVGKLRSMNVQSLGATAGPSHVYNIGGDAGTLTVAQGISNATVTIDGKLDNLEVGQRKGTVGDVINSLLHVKGDLHRLTLNESLTAGSTLNVEGAVSELNVGRSIADSTVTVEGAAQKVNIMGGISLSSTVNIGGDVKTFTVGKTVSDTTLSIGGQLGQARIGQDIRDCEVTFNTVEKLQIGDDLADTRMWVIGHLQQLQVDDVQTTKLRIGGHLGAMQVRRSLVDSTISVLNDIDSIKVTQDVNRSLILAGVDIGADFELASGDDAEWGDVVIQNINIGGDLTDSSVSAGVKPNGSYFGDGDDLATSNHVGTARIYKMVVRGQIMSTQMPGESYAITADDGVDYIRSQGRPFTGVPGVVLQEY